MSRAGKTAASIHVTGPGSAAVGQAAIALRAARRVLVTGLHGASLVAIRSTCDLAEALGAVIDTGTPDLAVPVGPIVARAGAVTADPAELRDRADLVVTWFCDPELHRPGFRTAFLEPPLADGQPRRLLAVGPEPLAAAGPHLRVPAESAVDLARLLHAILLGHAAPPENPAAAAVEDACRELAAAIRAATCVGFLTARTDDPLGLLAWASTLLVRTIAHERPAFAVPLDDASCDRGNDPTVADVLTWRYGAAGGIARADRLGAAFRPGECTAAKLIARGEVDLVLAVGRLQAACDAAIASRAGELDVVWVAGDDTAVPSLAALLEAVRDRPGPGTAR